MNPRSGSRPFDERELAAYLLALDEGSARAQAAGELVRIGVWSRGSLLPRGTVWSAAPNRLPWPERIASILRALEDRSDPEARAQAASAAGEWGGAESVSGLAAALGDDRAEVREQAIAALGTIGGPQATRVLLSALPPIDRPGDQRAVLDALEELLTGGRGDVTSAPSGIVRPSGAAPEFDALIDAVRGALGALVDAPASRPELQAARSKAQEILDLIASSLTAIESSDLSHDEIRSLLAEIDGQPDGDGEWRDVDPVIAAAASVRVPAVSLWGAPHDAEAVPPTVESSSRAIRVAVTVEAGTLVVRIDVVDPTFARGSAQLDFRGPDGASLAFKTVTGEPVDLIVPLTFEEDGAFYGEWQLAVNMPEAPVHIPEGTTLHVEPRRPQPRKTER